MAGHDWSRLVASLCVAIPTLAENDIKTRYIQPPNPPSSIEGHQVRFNGAAPALPKGQHSLVPGKRWLASDANDGTVGKPWLFPCHRLGFPCWMGPEVDVTIVWFMLQATQWILGCVCPVVHLLRVLHDFVTLPNIAWYPKHYLQHQNHTEKIRDTNKSGRCTIIDAYMAVQSQ